MMAKRKLSIAILSVVFALISCVSIAIVPVAAEEGVSVSITNSDFVGATGTEIGSINAESNEATDVTLPYTAGSAVYYGEVDAPYYVDMSSFSWSITINTLAVGQSFTVSFIKDTTAMPFNGAVGVSYVFRRTAIGIFCYILDAADGSLLQEMIDTPSMWAYYRDGDSYISQYLEDTDPENENYCEGMAGILHGDDFTGRKLNVVNMIDGASFSGTTYRPTLDGMSLGRTVPGTIFDNREIKAKNLVLVLSAGDQYGFEGVPTDSISFTLATPNDKNTKEYKSNSERLQLITNMSAYVTASEKAVNGLLRGEEYAQMLAFIENANLSALHTRERYIQENNLNEIRANIELVNEKLGQVPAVVNAYNTALQTLSNLDEVTEEKVENAENAKANYDNQSGYISYMQGEAATEINAIIATLDESLLSRAKLHLQLNAYEEMVAKLGDGKAETIVACQHAKAKVQTELLSEINATDKTAFESRIKTCDSSVETAYATQAYQVEEYKITLYKNAVDSLSENATVEELVEAYNTRPSLRLDKVLPLDRPVLEEKLSNADTAMGAKIVSVLKAWIRVYGEKVYELSETTTLTQAKIDQAKEACYDKDEYSTILNIIQTIGYDITEQKSTLEEYDRTVEAAPIRLLLVAFNNLSMAEISDVSTASDAYQAYCALSNDLSILSETEKTAYVEILSNATNAYETKVKAIITPAIEAFEAAVEVENINEVGAIDTAKNARNAVPTLELLIVEEDYASYTERYEEADEILRSQTLYYAYANAGGSWSLSETEKGLRLDNQLFNNQCNGLAMFEEAMDIDGLDFAFEFTEIGRIWKGEDPAGSGKYPQSIYVLNILNQKEKNKDQAQGFSIYFYCNVLNELEIHIYGAATASENMLASGKIGNCGFTNDPYVPYTVRVRISVDTNCYRIWINSTQLIIYFRDILNPSEDKVTHLPGYNEGEEIGDKIFENGKAYLTFVVFADSLAEEEMESAITIRMIGDKTFGDYVPPIYMVSLDLVSGPTKTTYQKGETFDKTGISMTATMSDGSTVSIPLAKIKVLGFTSTSKGQKNVSLSYTDESGVTLTKVIKVTIVDAENKDAEPKKGCGETIVMVSVIVAVVLIGAVVAVLVLKKNKKSA